MKALKAFLATKKSQLIALLRKIGLKGSDSILFWRG